MGTHPCVQVFLADACDVGFTRDLNIRSCLCDIDTVEKGNETKTFEGNGEPFVDEIEH